MLENKGADVGSEGFDLGGEWSPLRRRGLHKFQLLVHDLGWVGPITDHNHEGFLG